MRPPPFMRYAAALLLAFCTLFAAGAQAQTTYVSNTATNTTSGASTGISGSNKYSHAQQFTTGDNEDGYALSEVDAILSSVSGEMPVVSLYSDSSGEPGSSEFTFTNPTFSGNGTYTFSAPANTTLTKETKYWVVFENTGSGSYSVSTINIDNEDPGASSGWSIADTRQLRSSDTGNWSASNNELQIAVKGSTTITSTDATLSDLDLSWDDSGTETDIALTPTFATATLSYSAMVANGVSQILVDPTTTDDGATVEFLNENDMAIDDAESMEDGHQIALAEGNNTIKVKVTAEDTTIVETYTVVVTRAASVSVLVSNIDQDDNNSFDSVGSSGGIIFRQAQGFTTGDNPGGYTLARVRVELNGITGSEGAKMSIYTNSGGNPGSLLYTLVSPNSYSFSEILFNFRAPDDATLAANTTYHIVIEATSGGLFTGMTQADGEDSGGEADWNIADSRRESRDGGAWTSDTQSLRIRIFGKEDPASTDATLSDLELQNTGDSSAIGIFPSFAPEATSYSAWVRNDGAQITLTPSLNDDGATVEYLSASDLAIDDANTMEDGQQINLAEGFNTIKVKVTAEDTLTTETYTLFITRLAPILVHNLGQVGEDFTPTDTPAQAFTTGPNPGGYEIAQAWVNTQNQGTAFSASIWTTNANAEPDTLLYSLTAPDSFVGFAIFFGAPVDARLDPGTTYSLVLDTPASGLELRVTRGNGESAESASGWSIRDTAHFESSGSWADDPHGDSLHIGLSGRELSASTDASLSDLELQDTSDDSVITLTPTFATATTSYTAMVANGVDEILVAPTTNHDGATVEFLDSGDNAITDANAAEGQQIALAEGDNTIKVKVTAEDTMATQTYEIVVTRAASTTGATLVSNTGQTIDTTSTIGTGDKDKTSAQGFTTGSNAGGYTLDSVGVHVSDEDLESGEEFIVHIYTSNFGALDTLVHTLTSPASYTDGAVNLFTAPAGATLAADTDYLVAFEGTGNQSLDFELSLTDSTSEDSGSASDWSIEDDFRANNSLSGFGLSAMISVHGSEITNTAATGEPVITGAFQVGKTLTAGLGDIADTGGLPSTAFPTGYTFQWIRVDGSDGAETDISGETSQTYTPGTADVGNYLKVKVSFTDGGGVSESRAGPTGNLFDLIVPAAVSNCDANTVWCATLTSERVLDDVGDEEGVGFESSDGYGSVSPVSFMHLGVQYTVIQLNTGGPDLGFATTPVLPSGGAGLTLHVQSFGGEIDLSLADDGSINANDIWFFGGATDGADPTPLADISLLRFPSRNDSFQASTGHGAEIAVRLSAIPPLLTAAAVDGDTLVLSYDNTLDDTSTPVAGDFSVTVDSGTPAAPSNVSVSGSEVMLTLAAAVTEGQTVTVSYTSGTNPVQDENGLKAADLTDEAVTNDTVDPPTEIWSATLTVQGLGSGHRGCGNSSTGNECTDTANLTEDEFNYDSTDYDVTAVRVQSNGQLQIWFDPNLTGDATSMALIVDGETFRFEDADDKNANNRRWDDSGLNWATNADIVLRLTEDPGSSNANLSGLYVEDYFEEVQIPFTPNFSSGVTDYTLGRVANDVDTITIRPTKSDGDARVAYFDASGQAIEDYDSFRQGHDIPIDEGENVIEIEVTAEDGMTVKSYFLSVTRAPSSLPAGVLVSNYWQFGVRGTNSLQVSQSFTTGGNPTGYDLTGVAIEVNTFVSLRGALIRVVPAASNGEPDLSDPSRNVTLSNPATLSNGGLNVLTAPMGAKLAANTTYHVVATSADGMNSLGSVQVTNLNAEDRGSAAGWSIGDGLYQRVSDTAAWQQNTFALSMQILAELNTDVTECPPGNDWCAEMTVGVFAADSGQRFIGYAFSSIDPYGALDDRDFDFEGRTYNVRLLSIHEQVNLQDLIGIATDADWPLGPQFNFGGAEFVLEAYRHSRKDSLSWPLPSGMAWVEGQMVTVSVNFAPERRAVAVDNATLELTFHEALDESSVPAPGAFSVSIDGGNPVAPAGVAVSGDTVTLTLSAPAYKNQTVTLSYAPPAANPLQDVYGVKAIAFTNKAVTNNTLNTAAAGAPGISGAPQVGGTLSAERGSIADIDGLPSSFPGDYAFQWIRVDSTDAETDISGATGRDYSPVNADVGNRLKVRVSFNDNGGAPESRTSEVHPSLGYPVGGLTVQPRPAACPDDSDWCAEMTVEGREIPSVTTLGFDKNAYGALDDTEFVLGGVTYEVEQMWIYVEQDSVSVELSRPPPAGTVFDIGGAQVEFTSGNLTSTSALVPAGFVIVDGQQMTVSMKAGNLPARGKPVVVGAAVVGQTLTASAGGIFDWNGTERAVAGDSGFAFEYQWLQVDGNNETTISGATSDTYTLDAADVDKSIKAQVSFTDDLGNAEGPLGSEATAVVMAAGSNAVPVFDGGNTQTRDLDENIGESEDSSPREIGAAVSATDADNDSLTYSLGGADAAKFTIDPASGQLRTRAGERYDFERKPVYSLIVAVNDGTVELTANVTVRVVDLAEVPVTPSRVLIKPDPGDATAFEVNWALVGNDNRPEVQVYELRYRLAGQTSWPGALTARNREARITGLIPGRLYELQVRAVNADGASEWSDIARESTGQLPPPEISFGSASYTAIEGAAGATVEVEVFPPQNRALTIPITVTEQDGATADDWSGVPANVTVEAGQASASFIVTAAADEDSDDAESLLLGFGSLPGNATAGDPAEARVALLSDTSVVTWYVFFEEAEYGVTEGDSVTVTVGLSNPWKPAENEALTIGLFAPEHQGGARKKDYSGIPESVTFQPGQTRVSFTVTATDDNEDDDGESILLQFTRWNHDDLKTGRGPYPATVYLHDNDGLEEVRASFGERNYTVREGGFIDIEVLLDRPPGRELTIPIEVSTRNGAGPNDYTIETLEATFGATQTSDYIQIEAHDDNLNDDLEYLEILFGELPDKVSAEDPDTTIVNLEDTDNGLANVTVRMAGGGEKHEGGGTFLYIYLNEEQQVDVLVPLVVEHLDGATEDDYSGVPATVRIPAGEIRDGVIIDVLEDSDNDDGEGIRVDFGDLPAGVKEDRLHRAATYRFLDNDNVPQIKIQGDGAKEWPNPISYLKFIVTLDYIPEFEVSVDYATEDGTAVANQDYKPTSGTLTFSPGQRTKNLWVEVCSDGIDEDTERMTLRLSNPVRAEFRNGATASATGTISDYRGLGAKPCSTGIVIEDAEAREFPPSFQGEQDNEMTFDVRLNREAKQLVSVSYRTVDGTATAGQDYDSVSGVLRFEPGETEKTITVTVKTDLHDDPGETFTMLLSNPQGAYLGDGEATGTIKNSGPMPGAWLSRFGRVAADQAVQSVGERIREGTRPSRPNQFTLGGRRLDNFFTPRATHASPLHPPTEITPSNATGPAFGNSATGPASPDAPTSLLDTDKLFEPHLRGSVTGASSGFLAPNASDAISGFTGGGPGGGPGGDMGDMTGGMGGNMGGNARGTSALSPGGVPSPLIVRNRGPIALPTGGSAGAGPVLDSEAPGGRIYRDDEPSLLPGMRELMRGASFDYSRPTGKLGEDGEPLEPGWLGDWSAWGRTAQTRFSGAEGPLSINGDVNTATLGFDSVWGDWIGGVALSHSEGQGGYNLTGAGRGEVSSTLTTLMPYVSYSIDERNSVWGTIGYGLGDLLLTPGGADEGISTDLSTMLAAFGGRGLIDARLAGLQLAWVSDAMLTGTTSAKVANLNGAAGATGRLRLMLEGSGSMPLAGGILRPRMEAGLRYDAGDAETGAGLEVGGGLAYAVGRLSVEVNARGLTAHEDSEYEEWGFSSKIGFIPREDGRGLSINFSSTLGADRSGVQSLWTTRDAGNLVRGGSAAMAQRYQAELGYGIGSEFDFPKLFDKPVEALWLPYVRMETSQGSRAMTFGVKLTSGQALDAGLEFGRRSAGVGAPPEDAVMLQGQWRF